MVVLNPFCSPVGEACYPTLVSPRLGTQSYTVARLLEQELAGSLALRSTSRKAAVCGVGRGVQQRGKSREPSRANGSLPPFHPKLSEVFKR